MLLGNVIRALFSILFSCYSTQHGSNPSSVIYFIVIERAQLNHVPWGIGQCKLVSARSPCHCGGLRWKIQERSPSLADCHRQTERLIWTQRLWKMDSSLSVLPSQAYLQRNVVILDRYKDDLVTILVYKLMGICRECSQSQPRKTWK